MSFLLQPTYVFYKYSDQMFTININDKPQKNVY